MDEMDLFGGTETDIVFGDLHKVLRHKAICALPQEARNIADELLMAEHAVLIGFVWFIMGQKGDYFFELPRIDLSDSYDVDELLEELKRGFLWPGIDPVMLDEYVNERALASGYFRLKIPNLPFSMVDIYLSFCGGSGDSALLGGYEQRAKKLAWKEIFKVLEIPLFYLEEPEGRKEEIEKIIVKRNLYQIENRFELIEIDPETEQPLQPLISDKERERQEAECFAKAKKIINRLVGFGYQPSFVFVDPRLIEGGTEGEYARTKEKLKNKYGWDVLKSPDDLFDEFVGKGAQNEVRNQWREVADNIFSVFLERLKKNSIEEFLKYEKKVKEEICAWGQLDKQSKALLSIAEFLFNKLKDVAEEDFSAPALSYCKSLENEIREKLFAKFNADIKKRHNNFREYFSEDLKDKDTKTFGEVIAICPEDQIPKLTLGEMAKILRLTFKDRESLLFKEFREFITGHFKINSSFSKRIFGISEYRNRSAHPNGKLLLDEAGRCRKEVLAEINSFLISRISWG